MTGAVGQAPVDSVVSMENGTTHAYLCPVFFSSGTSCSLQCVIGGLEVPALIDSGSAVSIINSAMLPSLPAAVRVQQPSLSLFSVNNIQLSIVDAVSLDVIIEGTTFDSHVFMVSPDIAPKAILGQDFLQKSKAVLDFSGEALTVRFPLSRVTQTQSAEAVDSRVQLVESVVVPAYHCAYLSCVCTSPLDAGDVLVQGYGKFLEKFPSLEVGDTLLSGSQTNASFILPVFNQGGECVHLFHNTNVAIACPCTVPVDEGVDDVHIVSSVSQASSVPLEAQLNDLFALHDNLSSEHADMLTHLLTEFQDVFWWDGEPLGNCSVYPHSIDTGTASPVKQAARRLPYYRRSALKALLTDLLSKGIIRESCSPWASPIVLVSKKDGSTRLCVDYRQLNKLTKPDAFPLPRIDDTIDSLHGCTLFTTLDLASGYWQIALDESDRCKSAFACPLGLYEFTVLPMGVSNGPATFQRVMERVLGDLLLSSSSPICRCFFDDILVATSSVSDHVAMLKQVFLRLREAGLKLKLPKCRFLREETEFLGFSISGSGVATCQDKIAKVRDWPTPTNMREVQQFLGLASYYRRFIKGFSGIAAPLHALTKHDTAFSWTKACAAAFRFLKNRLISAPILAYPDFSKDSGMFILDADASQVGMGAVLSQRQGDVERVIGYASQVLTKSQRNYSTYERELLAVVTFAQQFRCYLLGKPFLLRSDHQAIRSLMSSKEPAGRRARWIEQLSEYQYSVEHRPGRLHTNADALSRLPQYECPQEPESSGASQVERTPQSSTPVCQVSAVIPDLRVQPEINFSSVSGLKDAQQSDPVLCHVLSWFDLGTGAFVRPPESSLSTLSQDVRRYAGDVSLLRMQDGVLYYLSQWNDTECDRLLLVIPDSLREQAVASIHCVPGGHQGQDKTLDKCRQRFFWLGLSTFVRNFVRCCPVCERSSKKVSPGVAPLGSLQTGYSFECVGIDLVGPLPISHRGSRFILVAVDHFSRWAEAYPLSDIRAETVTRSLVENWVSRYGAPTCFHSDQGTQFESAVFSGMCELLGVGKSRTTSYHPQGNGCVERLNRTLKELLRASAAANPLDWDLYLPFLLLTYRTSVHASTGFTPSRLLFGQELRLPVDLVFSLPDSRPKVSPAAYVQNLDKSLKNAQESARSFNSARRRVQKAWYDQRAHGHEFPDGSYVWVLDTAIPPGTSKTFHQPWKGPYQVISSSPPVYLLESTSGPAKRTRIHFNRLKACHSRVPSVPVPPVSEQSVPSESSYVAWPDDVPAPPPPAPPPPPQPPPPPGLAGQGRHRNMPGRYAAYHVPPRHQW